MSDNIENIENIELTDNELEGVSGGRFHDLGKKYYKAVCRQCAFSSEPSTDSSYISKCAYDHENMTNHRIDIWPATSPVITPKF